MTNKRNRTKQPIIANDAELPEVDSSTESAIVADETGTEIAPFETDDADDLSAIFASMQGSIGGETVEEETPSLTVIAAEDSVEVVLDKIAEDADLLRDANVVVIVAAEEVVGDAIDAVIAAVENTDDTAPTTVSTKTPRTPKVVDRSKFLDAIGAPDEATALAGFAGLAKKVREKIENAADAISSGKRLSVYTQEALKFALDNDNAFTVKGLVDMYEGRKYGSGTARAQAQQMGAVFAALGAADKIGKAFTLRDGPALAALKASMPTALAA